MHRVSKQALVFIAAPYFHICHISHIVLHYSRRVEDIFIVPVVKRFCMTDCLHDNRRKAGAGKGYAVVKMKQFFCLGQGSGIGMAVAAGFRACRGYELLFAITLKAAGLLVNAQCTKAKIDHLSKLGKEKDKEGEYGEGFVHALP
jgi:hypothetical protein